MYRITVNTEGKYNNVALGPRYCFFKKTAKHLIQLFLNLSCEIYVQKLVHVGDIFTWSDYEVKDAVFSYYEHAIGKNLN